MFLVFKEHINVILLYLHKRFISLYINILEPWKASSVKMY